MVAFGYSRAARVAQRLAQPRGQTSVCAQARVGGARLCARLPGDLRGRTLTQRLAGWRLSCSTLSSSFVRLTRWAPRTTLVRYRLAVCKQRLKGGPASSTVAREV